MLAPQQLDIILAHEDDVPLRNPYAGVFNREYLHFLVVRNLMCGDYNALFCLRENAWTTEGKLEIIRQWESYEYRRDLMSKMIQKGVIFSTNADDYFPMGHSRARLTPKFLNKIKSYLSSLDEEIE